MSPQKARQVREEGHRKAKEFARLIGMGNDYQNDPQAKKDIIDKNGDAHSVKSGTWWQIFLYRRSRIESDPGFQALNGIGPAILDCLDVFPNERAAYETDKKSVKERLGPKMVKLKELIQRRLKTFFTKGSLQRWRGSIFSYS